MWPVLRLIDDKRVEKKEGVVAWYEDLKNILLFS